MTFTKRRRTIVYGPHFWTAECDEYVLTAGGEEWAVVRVPQIDQEAGKLAPFLLVSPSRPTPGHSTVANNVQPEHLAISEHFALGMTTDGEA